MGKILLGLVIEKAYGTDCMYDLLSFFSSIIYLPTLIMFTQTFFALLSWKLTWYDKVLSCFGGYRVGTYGGGGVK